jgi:hypothetical protein
VLLFAAQRVLRPRGPPPYAATSVCVDCSCGPWIRGLGPRGRVDRSTIVWRSAAQRCQSVRGDGNPSPVRFVDGFLWNGRFHFHQPIDNGERACRNRPMY